MNLLDFVRDYLTDLDEAMKKLITLFLNLVMDMTGSDTLYTEKNISALLELVKLNPCQPFDQNI